MHDMAKPLTETKMKSRRGAMWKAIAGLVILIILLVGLKAMQIAKMMGSPMVMPPTTVSSVVVKEEDWAPKLSAVGSVSAVQGAVVSTELGGVVSKIAFENGSTAKKGDLLMQLDTSAEEAQLHSAEADLALARADVERSRDLAARKVISRADSDSAESKFNRLNAVVDQMRSNIRKKTVVAPFDGQLGIRQVNVGQSIDARLPVVQLTALDPVFVDFSLPEQYLSQLSNGLDVNVRVDALPDHDFKGKLTAVNSMVDSVTRNVTAQATLQNPEHTLRPGMFAKVEVVLPTKGKALVIPGSAVSYAPFGDSVFVVADLKDANGKTYKGVRQQFVKLGRSRGDQVAVVSGVNAGDEIVTSGVFKLRNGAAVVINNSVRPANNPAPKPENS